MADPGAFARTAAAPVPAPRRAGLAAALACVSNVAAGEWARFVAMGVVSVRTVAPLKFKVGSRRARAWSLALETTSGLTRAGTLTIPDAREAWETLATRGVIPMDWVECPARTFLGPSERGPECLPHCEPKPGGFAGHSIRCAHYWHHDSERGTYPRVDAETPHPPTVAMCVALAADAPGVLAAEQIARQHAAAYGHVVARVVWRVESFQRSGRPRADAYGSLWDLGYDLASIRSDDTAHMLCPPLGY